MYIYHYLDPPLLSITPSPHLSPLRANTNVDVDTLNRTYPVFLGIFKFQFISRRSPLPYLFASYFDACCSSGYLIILSVFFFFLSFISPDLFCEKGRASDVLIAFDFIE